MHLVRRDSTAQMISPRTEPENVRYSMLVLNQDKDLIIIVSDITELIVYPAYSPSGVLIGWNLSYEDYLIGTYDDDAEARGALQAILDSHSVYVA